MCGRQFWQPAEKFLTKVQLSLTQTQKKLWETNFSKKNLLHIFFWTRKIQFCQPCGIFFMQMFNVISLNSKKKRTWLLFSEVEVFCQMFPPTGKISFKKASGKIFQRYFKKTSLKDHEKLIKLKLIRTVDFPEKVFLRLLNYSCSKLAIFFIKRQRKFSLESKNTLLMYWRENWIK